MRSRTRSTFENPNWAGRLAALFCAPVLTAHKAAPLRCSESTARRLGPAGFERCSTSESGILLLETLIAFVIAALALVVVYKAVADGAAASVISRETAAAVARAQSRLAALEAMAPAYRYTHDGDDGDGFRFSEAATPLPQLSRAPLRAVRLSVTESWGAADRHVTLVTEVAVRAAGQS